MDEAWSTAHGNFMSSLTPAELQQLLKRATRQRVGRRTHLFRAGDTSGEVYVVASGCLELYMLSPGGKEIILWLLFPGEIFGIAECMRGATREIFAAGHVASEVLTIKHRDFVEFLRAHPEAAVRAIGILSARVRALGASVVELTSDDVGTRLARLLLRFTAGSLPVPCPAARAKGEVCINVDLTRTDFAKLVGASRQTVTTLLADFNRRGIVRPVGRHLHITDVTRLRRLSDEAVTRA